jgi:hypothetical protein
MYTQSIDLYKKAAATSRQLEVVDHLILLGTAARGAAAERGNISPHSKKMHCDPSDGMTGASPPQSNSCSTRPISCVLPAFLSQSTRHGSTAAALFSDSVYSRNTFLPHHTYSCQSLSSPSAPMAVASKHSPTALTEPSSRDRSTPCPATHRAIEW